MEELLTIEEAAAQLGISVATARRWAASGKISANKSGRQWVVDGGSLSVNAPRRRRRRNHQRSDLDLEQALTHIRNTDLQEVWVPDPLRFQDKLSDATQIIASASRRLENSTPGAAIEIAVDKTTLFSRNATLLSLEDRVAYQAAVASIAERIEAQTLPCVFSARLARNRRYFLRRGSQQWVAWQHETLKLFDSQGPWLVEADLTAYFDTVPHRLLFGELDRLGGDPDVIVALKAMLNSWSPATGVGLPQGPNASRLLGNLFLIPVDQAMQASGVGYTRYMDDMRIVAPTRAEAVDAVHLLQRECRNRGLIVSSAKSKLRHGDDARGSLRREADLDQIEYEMASLAPEAGRPQLRKVLRAALSKPDVNQRRAKFSLWRLARLRDDGVLGRVIKRLEDLGPISTVVAAYLRPFIARPRVVRGIARFLAEPSRSRSPYLVAWLFAVVLEHSGAIPSPLVDQARARLQDRNGPAFVRALAAIVVARGGQVSDLNWLRNDIKNEHDPHVLRGFAAGLHAAKALDRQAAAQLVGQHPDLRTTVTYLRGRPGLSSLIRPRTPMPL